MHRTLGLFAMFALGCPTPPAEVSCRADGDCASASVCVDGRCQTPADGEGEGEGEGEGDDAGRPVDPCSVPADNHYEDGGFELGMDRWTSNAVDVEVLDDADHCGAFVRVTPTGGAIGQIFQVGDDLIDGQRYRVRYDVRGVDRDCNVRIIDHRSPFNNWGFAEQCSMTPDAWRRFESTFVASTPNSYSGGGARVHILLDAGTRSSIDVDNLVVVPEG